MKILHRKDAKISHQAIVNFTKRFIEKFDSDLNSKSYEYKVEHAFKLAQRDLETQYRNKINELKSTGNLTHKTKKELTSSYHKKWKLIQRSFWYWQLETYIQNSYSGRAMSGQELAVILLNDRENWNRKTTKRWRKVTINDIAMIIGFSSSTPVKIIWIIRHIKGTFRLYKDAYLLYEKFKEAGVKSRMFNWLIIQPTTTSSDQDSDYFKDGLKDLEATEKSASGINLNNYFTKGF